MVAIYWHCHQKHAHVQGGFCRQKHSHRNTDSKIDLGGRQTGRGPKRNDQTPRKPTETQGPCPDLRGFCIKALTVHPHGPTNINIHRVRPGPRCRVAFGFSSSRTAPTAAAPRRGGRRGRPTRNRPRNNRPRPGPSGGYGYFSGPEVHKLSRTYIRKLKYKF